MGLRELDLVLLMSVNPGSVDNGLLAAPSRRCALLMIDQMDSSAAL